MRFALIKYLPFTFYFLIAPDHLTLAFVSGPPIPDTLVDRTGIAFTGPYVSYREIRIFFLERCGDTFVRGLVAAWQQHLSRVIAIA